MGCQYLAISGWFKARLLVLLACFGVMLQSCNSFIGYKLGRETIFDFLKTEKWCENYYGQLAVAVPSHHP